MNTLIIYKVLVRFLIINIFIIGFIESSTVCPYEIKFLCNEKEKCDECIQAHHCCNWCYQENNITIPRCNFIDDLRECGEKVELNSISEMRISESLNINFTEIKSMRDAKNVIQIKPQGFNLKLRKDVPINITFVYKAAKNYPLELYYLGDLSFSMKSHLDTLKNLGDDLGHSLENLTLNYRLAYGSFLDKPGMPFYYTDEKKKNDPCMLQTSSCEKGYLFKHRLNFTKDTNRFFEEVRNSKTSANIDDLDGALEAIFQVLVCNKRFGWSKLSRKLILLSTDSLLHSAGDGLLVGAVRRNNAEECLVDETGNYTDPFKYDYPSIGEIHTLLKRYKVNLIIAVKNEKIKFYQRLASQIFKDEVFLGELEDNSENILNLVSTGYTNFIRQVQFSANTSHAPEIDVKFFGDCHGNNDYNTTSGCYNVEEEKPFTFKMQIALNEFTSKKKEIIYVLEKNINEELKIEIEYVGSTCTCASYTGDLVNCNDNGEFHCGACKCKSGWTGEFCNIECDDNGESCRKKTNNSMSSTCFGNGDCRCGKCLCEYPYSGTYCEYLCPINRETNQVCSGEYHGVCIKGVCQCESSFIGEDCSCSTSEENCRLLGTDNLCNGHGTCKCNTCQCEEGFEGTYCEKTPEKNVFCEIYEKYVEESVENGTTTFDRDGIKILVEDTGLSQGITCESDCQIIYFSTATRCTLNYCYHRGEDKSVHLLTKEQSCILTGTAKMTTTAIAIFAAVVLGGLIMIFLQKYRIFKADQAEYKRFINEQKSWTELNPLYKSPVTVFNNPLAKNN